MDYTTLIPALAFVVGFYIAEVSTTKLTETLGALLACFALIHAVVGFAQSLSEWF